MNTTNTNPDLPIIFEDSRLLIINKPAGLLSQADHTGDPDVLSLCKAYLNRIPNGYLGLIHRLDRPVSGLMMLAKTPQATKSISKQMRDHLIQKTYHTVVYGRPPANGVLIHYLIKNKSSNIVRTVPAGGNNGKRAVLSFAKLKSSEELSLLSIHLQTGRSHQIRVQLAEEGYFIWGDYKYGRNQPDGRQIALRAVELVFNHPESGEEMRLKLPPLATEPWNEFNSV